VIGGNPVEALLRAARECGADLLVLGSHGRRGSTGSSSGASPNMSCGAHRSRFSSYARRTVRMHRATQRNGSPPMFDDELQAAMAQAMISNRRANSWIMPVPNRTFLEQVHARYVPEGRGCVALLPARRFGLLQSVRAMIALLAAAIFGAGR